MQNLKTYILLITITNIFLSCGNQNKKEIELNEPSEIEFKSLSVLDTLIELKNYEISKEHENYFINDTVGSFIKAYHHKSELLGIDENIYLIDGCIMLPITKVDSLIFNRKKVDSLIKIKSFTTNIKEIDSILYNIENQFGVLQYRTRELITYPRTIKIAGLNVSNSTMQSGLINTIERYNQVDLDLNFEFGGWWTIDGKINLPNIYRWQRKQGIDIIVMPSNSEPSGARAGFPQNSNPYSFVFIGNSIPNCGINVTTHVIMHEIGHCIGLRHTDFFNRGISCGEGGNEGPGRVGSIHIPGTPAKSNIDMQSVMLACYSCNYESSEFSYYDKVALRKLYKGGNSKKSININSRNKRWQTIRYANSKNKIVQIVPDASDKWMGSSNSRFCNYLGFNKRASNVYVRPGENELSVILKINDGNKTTFVSAKNMNNYRYRISSNNCTFNFVANDEPNPRNPNGGYNDNQGYITVNLNITN